jgi:hypothetical protein
LLRRARRAGNLVPVARVDDRASDDSPAPDGSAAGGQTRDRPGADGNRTGDRPGADGGGLDQPADALDLDAAVAELYGGPPAAFVAGRDALARMLRTGGRRDDATVVKALRKPKSVAWALDAAAVTSPTAVDEVVAAAEAVTGAQEVGGDVRSAIARLREAEGALASAAADAARDHGHPVDRATLSLGLRAVVGDPPALATLRAGRLVDVPTPGGLAPEPTADHGYGTPASPGGRGEGDAAGPTLETGRDHKADPAAEAADEGDPGSSRRRADAGAPSPGRPGHRRGGRRATARGGPGSLPDVGVDAGAVGATEARGADPTPIGPGERPSRAARDDAHAATAAARAARRAVAAAGKQVRATAAAARKAASQADVAERAAKEAELQAGAARRRADEARAAADDARRESEARAVLHRDAEAALATAEAALRDRPA